MNTSELQIYVESMTKSLHSTAKGLSIHLAAMLVQACMVLGLSTNDSMQRSSFKICHLYLPATQAAQHAPFGPIKYRSACLSHAANFYMNV